jgi:hypothetical protein
VESKWTEGGEAVGGGHSTEEGSEKITGSEGRASASTMGCEGEGLENADLG